MIVEGPPTPGTDATPVPVATPTGSLPGTESPGQGRTVTRQRSHTTTTTTTAMASASAAAGGVSVQEQSGRRLRAQTSSSSQCECDTVMFQEARTCRQYWEGGGEGFGGMREEVGGEERELRRKEWVGGGGVEGE